MTTRDVYDVLDLLLKGQTSGVRLLEFLIKDNFDSNDNLQDNEISELSDPPTPPPKSQNDSLGGLDMDNTILEENDVSDTAKRTAEGEPHTASSRNMGIDGGTYRTSPQTISPRETGANDAIAEIFSDHSAQFSAECNTDITAIEPRLQDSESAIEVSESIQNIAHANIIPNGTANKGDPILYQQGANVKTTNAKSKKRAQKEMEDEGEEDSGKQTKKRSKIVVPAREQSLR
jgi:hypothetical protein